MFSITEAIQDIPMETFPALPTTILGVAESVMFGATVQCKQIIYTLT